LIDVRHGNREGFFLEAERRSWAFGQKRGSDVTTSLNATTVSFLRAPKEKLQECDSHDNLFGDLQTGIATQPKHQDTVNVNSAKRVFSTFDACSTFDVCSTKGGWLFCALLCMRGVCSTFDVCWTKGAFLTFVVHSTFVVC
jgi:hypothetical protein